MRRMRSDTRKMVSTHIIEAMWGTYSFKVVGYSHLKGLGVGQHIKSDIFTIGSFDCAFFFYPDGVESSRDYVIVDLQLVSKHAEVRVSHELSLINQTTGLAEHVFYESTPRVVNSQEGTSFTVVGIILRSELEHKSAGYIKNNSLTIQCTIHVSPNPRIMGELKVEVPHSDLSEHFGRLLEDEEKADFRFVVGGQSFLAHKIVLATRSPVFNAQLYGQMKEGRAQSVAIEDIQPDVFKALLHFIYTDELPSWDDLEVDDYYEINRHLLMAADRYGMERLKLLCAKTLADNLDTENVATTLALADQHNCNVLKDICIEFMAFPDKMDAVVATQGYANLKRTCPSLLVDVLERSIRCRKA